MEWVLRINKAICYIEENLMEELNVEIVSNQVFASKYNFQRLFHLVTGVTIGEYIRSRRLSLAGRDLLHTNSKVVDVALKYRYDTSESFSKAFSRFHGISPSEVQSYGDMLKFFYPLSVNISIQGGFNKKPNQIGRFYWSNIEKRNGASLTDSEKYQEIIRWARKAREKNPDIFDALNDWLLDDSEWIDSKLPENEQILMHGVFARFKEQNTQIRSCLSEIKTEVVNKPVFYALDQFDSTLCGQVHDKQLRKVVAQMFADFSVMKKHDIRVLIAGSKTGPMGINHADLYGFINCLKDCDAEVQWALFMPDKVKRQQSRFKIESFSYEKMSAMRFIGREDGDLASGDARKEIFHVLDAMNRYQLNFCYDIYLTHHYGLCIDVDSGHGFWGRFMKADTPVPKGFVSFDFVPYHNGGAGAPYISQFAYAVFSGDYEAMHERKGYDRTAMYDVTRNTILSQGVHIPYPDKYWVAEVFLDGYVKGSTAYMFSTEL